VKHIRETANAEPNRGANSPSSGSVSHYFPLEPCKHLLKSMVDARISSNSYLTVVPRTSYCRTIKTQCSSCDSLLLDCECRDPASLPPSLVNFMITPTIQMKLQMNLGRCPIPYQTFRLGEYDFLLHRQWRKCDVPKQREVYR
jgi:hypothetical protein